MTFRIHYEIGEYEDSIVVTEDTIEDVRSIALAEMEKRGVDFSTCWSEEIK